MHFRLPDRKYIPAMKSNYALLIQLYQSSGPQGSMSGTVYLDNVGFILR